MKKIVSYFFLLLLLSFPFLSTSAGRPTDAKWGSFALVKGDYLLFSTNFASTEYVAPITKYTAVYCLASAFNTDSSMYIYITPFDAKKPQVPTKGFIARTGLHFISLDDFNAVINGLLTPEEVLIKPDAGILSFMELPENGQCYIKTQNETTLFISPRPNSMSLGTIPQNTEILILMHSIFNDEGHYCLVLDLRNESIGFVKANDIS